MCTHLTFLFLIIYTISIPCNSVSIDYLRSLTPAEVADLTTQQLVHSWEAYKQYAWGCDALYPQTKGCHNYVKYSNMWTPIDALDTMYLMGLDDLVTETIDLLCNTPYYNQSKFTFLTNQSYGVFDYFLRSLGGLISAYYFTEDTCLYNLAVEVADAIYPIFNEVTPSKSGLPWSHINLGTGEVDKSYNTNSPAEAGTHTLEYGIMSVITGDLKYWNASMNAMRILYNAKSNSTGLIGGRMYVNYTSDIHSHDFFTNTEASIASGSDSYYEYIVKCWALFNNSECKHWWLHNINSSIIDNLSYYTKNAATNDDLLWFKRIDMYTGEDTSYDYDLFSPFISGLLSLSSVLANDENDLNLAKLNQEANWYLWNKYSIEPWVFDFKGDYAAVNSYNLNPENFESNYYLYMITNDSLYYDRALIYLYDLMKYCKCDGIYNASGTNCVGYTGMTDVSQKHRSNSQPSYWFAESLKYLYLTFMRNEKDNPLPFHEFVFNTEAHPYPKTWGYKLNYMMKHLSFPPTQMPTEVPTEVPTEIPTEMPTEIPTEIPSEMLTQMPSEVPTMKPIIATELPTRTTEMYSTETTMDVQHSKSHQGENITIISVVVSIVIILIIGGVYYYFVIRKRKHEAQNVNFQMLRADATSIN